MTAVGTSLFGAAVASLLGEDPVGVANAGIGRGISGYFGVQIYTPFELVPVTGIQATPGSAVLVGTLEAIMS